MDNISEEVEKIVKIKDSYLEVKNFCYEFLEEKLSLKKDLERLIEWSEKAVETCDNVLYSENLYSEKWYGPLIFEFNSRNKIIAGEVSKIRDKILPYLSGEDDKDNFYGNSSLK